MDKGANMEDVASAQEVSSQLKQPIDISKILGEGTTFEVNYEQFKEAVPEDDNSESDDLINLENLGGLNIEDEEDYDDQEPFEHVSKKMVDIVPKGLVKKRIIREGYGEIVPEKSIVYIDYNIYTEYNEMPLDSTYLRNKQHSFRIGEGRVLLGMDIGVQTMKVNEKAQFLIQPLYAYGAMGCLDVIGPNTEILVEMELHKFVNSGAAVDFEDLPDADKNKFSEMYKYALALCEKGNDLINQKKNVKAAIKEYNMAVGKMEYAVMSDYDEQEKQQKLLMRLYINLVISYMKIQQPKKCCLNCNKIYNMCRNTDIPVPMKVYYNNAKALVLLDDLEMAEKRLRLAAKINRDRPEIIRMFLHLEKLKAEKREREKQFATLLFGGRSSEASDEFKKKFSELCVDLKTSVDAVQYELPDKLSEKEINFVRDEANRNGLQMQTFNKGGVTKYTVNRPTDN